MSCVEGVVNWLKTKKRSENSLAILNDICRFFCATPDSVLFRFLWSVYIGAFSSLLQVFFLSSPLLSLNDLMKVFTLPALCETLTSQLKGFSLRVLLTAVEAARELS